MKSWLREWGGLRAIKVQANCEISIGLNELLHMVHQERDISLELSRFMCLDIMRRLLQCFKRQRLLVVDQRTLTVVGSSRLGVL